MSLSPSRFRDRFQYERLDKDERSFSKRQFKTAILGAERSGRKEIMHQIRCICKTYSELQRLIFKESISNKVLNSLLHILEGMDKNSVRFTVQGTQDLANAFKTRLQECRGHRGLRNLVGIMLALWSDDNLQKYFKESVSDKSGQYFLKSLGKISSEKYLPTDKDIHVYINFDANYEYSNKLVESIEEMYEGRSWKFIGIDVINIFDAECIRKIEECHYIVFCVSLADYDILVDNGELNAFETAIISIGQLLSIASLNNVTFGLLFTNKDLFEEKLKSIVLKQYFPEFKGENNVMEAYNFIWTMFRNDPIIKYKCDHSFFYLTELSISDQSKIRVELLSEKVFALHAQFEFMRIIDLYN